MLYACIPVIILLLHPRHNLMDTYLGCYNNPVTSFSNVYFYWKSTAQCTILVSFYWIYNCYKKCIEKIRFVVISSFISDFILFYTFSALIFLLRLFLFLLMNNTIVKLTLPQRIIFYNKNQLQFYLIFFALTSFSMMSNCPPILRYKQILNLKYLNMYMLVIHF